MIAHLPPPGLKEAAARCRRPSAAATFGVVCGLVALAFSAVGCASTEDGEASGKPKVLATFTVITDMTENIGGDRIEASSITKPGTEIHGYEPTPSDLAEAQDADLILDNGLGLERWFEQFIERVPAERVTLTEGIEPIQITGSTEDAGKPNPHAWMSIDNAHVYVDNIREALTELDPGGEAVFRRNAERYKRRLGKVASFVRRELADLPENHRLLATCEGAFAYLARDFDLEQAYLWPVNAEQEGTPRQIASVVDVVREHDVPAVFCESTVSDKAQRQVASESGARFAGILYVDSLSSPNGPVPTYEALLRRNAETIVAGLTGGGER